MENVQHRYKDVTVLLVVIAAQLVLLAYQIKSNQDMRLIRVWSVTAVTPVARVVEAIRGGTVGFVKDYFVLLNAREENARLKQDLDKVKIENQYLKSELDMADRAKSLALFQERTPSKTVGARIIGNTTGANSKVVFVDRGTLSGVRPGMGVITADGIVGKVVASYPTAAQVMLVYDSTFAAGVISEKLRVSGTVKGQGHGTLIVDYIPGELKVEVGEKFFTSGDDRIFPKGLLVGVVRSVKAGRIYQEIALAPTGFARGLEEVLIIVEGVHQAIPVPNQESPGYKILAPPQQAPEEPPKSLDSETTVTEADRIRDRIRRLGAGQSVRFGMGGRIPNFNAPVDPQTPLPSPAAAPPQSPPQ